MLTHLQYKLLKIISSGEPDVCKGSVYQGKSKLATLLGQSLLRKIPGTVVVDFGCGEGHEVIELANAGARRVIGIDYRNDVLEVAWGNARRAGVEQLCEFTTRLTDVQPDIIISIDSFEHFDDPAEILSAMDKMLAPGGEVLISFGPTWYHPLGGHLFSVFPWAHLLFTEKALIRWRFDIRSDGATRFREVAGGLNQMTIHRFEQLVKFSPFRFESFETVPIAKLRSLHNHITREFTTAIVRCRLVKC